MPTLPRLDGPQVRDANVAPALIKPTQALTSNVTGKQAADLAQAGFQIFETERRKGDQVAILEADRRLGELENNLLYDPKTGLMNRQGKESFTAPAEANERFSKGIAEIEASLKSEEQIASFKKLSYSRVDSVNKSVNRHVSEQIQRYDVQETEAYLKNEQNAVISDPFNMERVQLAITRQQESIKTFAQRHGLPEEMAKQQLDEATSKTHSIVVDQMLAKGNDLAAQKYFETNKDQITGKTRENLEKDLEEGYLRGSSQRMSDDIFSKNMSMSASFDEAKKIEDPKLREETIRKLRENYTLKDMADRDRKEKINVEVGNIIDKTGKVDSIPPNIWNTLSTGEKSAYMSYAKNRQQGIEPTTDWKAYYDLKTLASTPEGKAAFMSTDLYGKYRTKMADTEFKELVSLQNGTRNGTDDSKKTLEGIQTHSQIVNGALAAAGIDTGSNADDSDVEKSTLFKRLVDEQVIAKQRETGKQVTTEDVQAITDKLMVKTITNKRWYWANESKRAFELGVEDKKNIEVDFNDIPKAEKTKIEEALKRNNLPVTEASILKLFTDRLKGQ